MSPRLNARDEFQLEAYGFEDDAFYDETSLDDEEMSSGEDGEMDFELRNLASDARRARN